MSRYPTFNEHIAALSERQQALIIAANEPDLESFNGVFMRFKNPVVTAAHVPLSWRYDLNPATNPLLLERLGVNATLNCGAIEWKGKILLAVRVEGVDRKSFIALAESDNGIDGFKFVGLPLIIPELDDREVNHYDMRLVAHEDGWIYGIFCVERENTGDRKESVSNAIAQCGIVRSKNMEDWERLPDLKTNAPQQRNAVLHPEFIDGKYAFYTRPQDGFVNAGTGGGIGWGLSDSIENPVIGEEKIIDRRYFHTIKESKNGAGAAPIKTSEGWLHIAHGVRECAAGMRYVLYAFMTELSEPWKLKYAPGGYILAPIGDERVGDVSNVLFTNGLIKTANDRVLLYYASSDTRCHVAESSVQRLVDYCKNTPPDPLRSQLCVKQRIELILSNLNYSRLNHS